MQSHIAKLKDVDIHFRLNGAADAPLLVFSNSLGSDFRIWDGVVAALGAGFRILRYDKRGHGLSGCPSDDWGMQDHVSDLASLMDRLNLKAATVCGLSVGGMIAQGLAAERPDLVARLVLCDTAAKIGSPDMWDARIEAVKTQGMASVADAILERWFAPKFIADDPNFPMWRQMLLLTPAIGYVKTCAAIRDTDLMVSTSRLGLPSLAIVGEKDGSTPPDLVREMAELIDGCRFEIVRNAGHLPCVEQPRAVADLLLGFLQENAG